MEPDIWSFAMAGKKVHADLRENSFFCVYYSINYHDRKVSFVNQFAGLPVSQLMGNSLRVYRLQAGSLVMTSKMTVVK